MPTIPARLERRVTAGLVVSALSLGAAGCDETFTVSGSRPSLTWVTVIPEADAAAASVFFWIRDLEGDSVDVTARWEGAEGAGGEIVQVRPGVPLLGLPTRDAIGDPDGQEHRIVWDLAGIPEGTVRLVFTADDDPRDEIGPDTWHSPDFDPRAGLTPAAAWSRMSP